MVESKHRIFYHDRWRVRPSRAGVVSVVLSRHVAIVLLPIMVVTLAVALEAQPILGLLFWAYPIGLLVAVLWTRAWFNSTIGAVLTRTDAAAVLTFAELTRNTRPSWQRVTDVRASDGALEVTVGLSPYRLANSDWSSLAELTQALNDAHRAATEPSAPDRRTSP